MSGRDEEHDGKSIRTWLPGVLVIVVIAAALGGFGSLNSLQRPELDWLNIFGIVVMFAGLALAMFSGPLAERVSGERLGPIQKMMKLGGMLVCCAGAILVFV